MTRAELKNLHQIATTVRDLAHKAYEIALKNRQTPGDTEAAYQTLLEANRAMTAIYAQIVKLSSQPTIEEAGFTPAELAAAPAPQATPFVETPAEPTALWRVTYVTSGLRRRTRTVDAETMDWLNYHGSTSGMRLISRRRANEAEIARGAFTGGLNQ